VTLKGLLPLLRDQPEYARTLGLIRTLGQAGSGLDRRPTPALDLSQFARPYAVAVLQEDWPGTILLVTGRPERSRDLVDQLRTWSAFPERIQHLASPDSIFYDRPGWDRQTSQARAGVLAMLSASRQHPTLGQGQVIVASIWALMSRTAPPTALRRATRTIRPGMITPLFDLLTALVNAGYEASVVVEEPGTFSHRGSIVDVYPTNASAPLRIDLFGDEVDSIRTFDPATQRSGERVAEAVLAPASEALPEWGKAAAAQLAQLDLSDCNTRTRQRMAEEIEQIGRGAGIAGLEYYLPYLYPRAATPLDHLPEGSLILIDDLTSLESASLALENQALSLRADMVRDGDLPARFAVPYFTWPEIERQLSVHPTVNLGYGLDEGDALLGRQFAPAPTYGGQVQDALGDIDSLHQEGQRVVLVSRQAERLADLLRGHGMGVVPTSELLEPPTPGSLTLIDGILAEGCALPAASLTVLTDAEVFGWVRQRRRALQPRDTAPEALFADLKQGDYVVHVEYGIGRYHGMVRKSLAGLEREYMEIEYEAGDRLFVPIQHADRISRYLGADDRQPYLHRLGGTEWALVRARAEQAVRDIARELLELYALRELAQGHAFPQDTVWQHEMEAAFPYVETDDQLRAVEHIKGDMEQPRPMDRLLVGDVGYGKTEVAVRAAFKAVMDGKQVAVLVPTTVLAQQHYYTFRRRLRAFPVVVEMLSRFKTDAELDEIIERLRAGQVDIVIGTHRLLSRDVAFKDLGLLVVDEEQRFGVAHKERLKQMRRDVDVLTMTATPIPRTLYMSLSGIRDMSVIDTPPENRVAVKTLVTEYEEGLVRKAILREMDRGGQTYYVHNRVQDIELVAADLHRIVPEASVVIGHGQMPEDELAQVMLGFAQGDGNILLCTTIIENGLDIPNVNTIIVDDADHFGLSQLYQLRGRVGRGIDRAYAYLLFKPPLTDIAQQRLQTILEASELGAGYRVAMRDMEIRGAGELLGAEQHGHIAAIGFDLYTRLLRRAIEELQQSAGERGDPIRRAQDRTAGEALALDLGPSIDLPLSAHLPQEYVPDDPLRLRLYRRLARAHTEADVAALTAELEDRFGPLPAPVANLLYVLRVRVLAADARVTAVRSEGQDIVVQMPETISRSVSQAISAAVADCQARGLHVRLKSSPGWQTTLLKALALLKPASRA
jgi:transcription-repair coupling factor (superfamily II helicase)